MAAYLQVDPKYAQMYDEVWMWRDYPKRGSRPDTGIDLVAKAKDSGELTAIQCKFYAPSTVLQKPDVDSFLATSSKAEFAQRMIISTTDKWGKNANEAIENQSPPVDRLGAGDLEESPIDWAQFSLKQPGELKTKKKHEPRGYQREAIDAVKQGFEEADRGKLIMACGTGKTFTSLKLAEEMVPAGGSVLFLVPSISLLSQTLREWTTECARDLRAFAVCSDTSVGKRKTEDMTVTDLSYPASTSAERLAERWGAVDPVADEMTVVFSTYQSIAAVAGAQKLGLPAFDLIISDEAHRTTGVTLASEDESAFVQVHNEKFLHGQKRLYMTATPRIYGDADKARAVTAGALISDMNDPEMFGEEFHRLGFAKAVEQKILTDYKVLVLAVDEGHVSKEFQGLLGDKSSELQLEDAAKLVGCWNGLAKRGNVPEEFAGDPEPMRRAVAFAGTINTSKTVTRTFDQVVSREVNSLDEDPGEALRCSVKHVDGTQNVLIRNGALDWLKADPDENECRILSNARCLSEGVDVPALDAVLFLSPRKSQVDVVQSVGRVMRKLEGKNFGYVILPIAVPAGVDPEKALAENKKYEVIWQVLQALRSHDERMNAIINKLDLTGNDTKGKISLIGIGGDSGDPEQEGEGKGDVQLALPIPNLDQWRDAIFARIVKKVGDRQYWDTWASDIAKIARAHITRITALVDGSNPALRKEFESFLTGLQDNLNPYIDREEAIEMLAQHLITKPVFDALFEGYSFSESNPVSQVMQSMIDALEPEQLETERRELEEFYDSVRLRAAGVTDPAARQGIIKDLYETFFRLAFKDTADRLGIVYTPVEIVDFILKSADEALRDQFGVGLDGEGVHVLDPFTGTGTFIVRLIQSGLISRADLERKFQTELHANELVLLAYYVAAINIEEAFHSASEGEYVPFDGIVLTDTFQMHEGDDRDEFEGMEVFPENNERVKRQKAQPIRVIVGNPPYSAGQSSGNDDNQNLKYPDLDSRIEATYAKLTSVTSKRTLYDSYIRAIRWASDRIGDRGVVCFVSNGGFIESNTTDGLRKSLTEEFTRISVFNLRGNTRTSGEQAHREGGQTFGSSSRATIAITLLVKDPEADRQGKLLYHDIGEYLTRDQKLAAIGEATSFSGLPLKAIVPNEDGDWISQRDPLFAEFTPVGSKDKADIGEVRFFSNYSLGLATGRDSWTFNFSENQLADNIRRSIEFYNGQVVANGESIQNGEDPVVDRDPKQFSWNSNAEADLRREKQFSYKPEGMRTGIYRPFMKVRTYFDHEMNARVYQLPKLFPTPQHENFGIYYVGMGSAVPFSVLMLDSIPNLHVTGAGSGGQFFPRYRYIERENIDNLLEAANDDGSLYRRVDNITDEILAEFRGSFGEDVTKDDTFFYVYGLLHSPDYRDRFQADLKKMLPRIPKVEGFREFVDAGRQLSELHKAYESVEPYPLAIEAPMNPDYRVKKMKFAGSGKNKDRSTIIYNEQIKVAGIPEEAYRYMLGSRSAIEWIIDRYQVKTDKKSGIVNDPNDWAAEHDDPTYILDLLARIVTVSIETMKLVDGLPSLEILEQPAQDAENNELAAHER